MERHVNPEDPDLYALGALDGEERRAFEEHVHQCPACAQALEAARHRVALVGLTAPPAAPAPGVRAALMQKVRDERHAKPFSPVMRAGQRRGWAPAFATGTIFFALLAAWLAKRNQEQAATIHQLQGQLMMAQDTSREIATAAAETDRMMVAPGTIHVVLAQQPGEPGGRAGVLYNAQYGTVVYTGQLPPAAGDQIYQLWLVPAKGAPLSLGIFAAGQPSTTLTASVARGTEAKAFAVTLEPQGGSPQPTGPKVLVGPVS